MPILTRNDAPEPDDRPDRNDQNRSSGNKVDGMGEPSLIDSSPDYKVYSKDAAKLEAQRFKEAAQEMQNFIVVARAQKNFEEVRAKLYKELQELQALYAKAEISKEKFRAQLRIVKRKYGLAIDQTKQAETNANRAIDERLNELKQRSQQRRTRQTA
jgi:hypothetical protein